MKIKIFDPTGIKPDDYRHRYPELERSSEFTELSSRALMFVWYYANETSDLVLDIPDNYERVKEALKKSGFNPSKTERENILRLQFDNNMAIAIRKMASFDPGVRFRSYKIVRTVFNEYEKLIKKGPTVAPVDNNEELEDSGGKKNPYYIDRYVVTSARIVDALPSLIAKMEEGFGVVDISGNEVEEDNTGAATIREWHRSKESNE